VKENTKYLAYLRVLGREVHNTRAEPQARQNKHAPVCLEIVINLLFLGLSKVLLKLLLHGLVAGCASPSINLITASGNSCFALPVLK